MTREIKFRAWDEQRKEFMDNNIFFVYGNGDIGFTWSFPIAQKYTEKPPRAVLMQYTGLKDKNGKLIYEGDIVFDEDGEYSKTVVIEWNNEDATFFGKDIYTDDSFSMQEINGEIIGDIYSNPQLLENHG